MDVITKYILWFYTYSQWSIFFIWYKHDCGTSFLSMTTIKDCMSKYIKLSTRYFNSHVKLNLFSKCKLIRKYHMISVFNMWKDFGHVRHAQHVQQRDENKVAKLRRLISESLVAWGVRYVCVCMCVTSGKTFLML